MRQSVSEPIFLLASGVWALVAVAGWYFGLWGLAWIAGIFSVLLVYGAK
jgi:ABC-type long-subunit fatty acid transport system fused permease/ATPase subunit